MNNKYYNIQEFNVINNKSTFNSILSLNNVFGEGLGSKDLVIVEYNVYVVQYVNEFVLVLVFLFVTLVE
jgi:hypothetical protein